MSQAAETNEIRLAWIPCPNSEVAAAIAEAAIVRNLAACANIVPGVAAIYRWKGEIRHDSEVILLVKTTTDRELELTEVVVAMHPYELPAISYLPVSGGHGPFLDWIRAETSRPV